MAEEILYPRRKSDSVHYLDRDEFAELVVSRRKLERVWMHLEAGVRVRDAETGDVYVLRVPADVAEDSGSAERMPAIGRP